MFDSADPLVVYILVILCGGLLSWVFINLNRRIDKHGKHIDDLFELIRELTVAMAQDSVKRPEFEAKIRQVEAKIDKLYIEFQKK